MALPAADGRGANRGRRRWAPAVLAAALCIPMLAQASCAKPRRGAVASLTLTDVCAGYLLYHGLPQPRLDRPGSVAAYVQDPVRLTHAVDPRMHAAGKRVPADVNQAVQHLHAGALALQHDLRAARADKERAAALGRFAFSPDVVAAQSRWTAYYATVCTRPGR